MCLLARGGSKDKIDLVCRDFSGNVQQLRGLGKGRVV